MIDLGQLNFFKKFPKRLVNELNQLVELVSVDSGNVILAQDQVNESLYFLISGRLGVYVDGGKVAMLDQTGDLIGEMSLITKQKSSAAIKAESLAQLYKIDGNALHKLSEKEGVQIQYNLYRIYSDILSQKLEITNHRAKHFEDLTNELKSAQRELEKANESLEQKVIERTTELSERNEDLKQKNDALNASYEKMSELFQNRDATFRSLESLLNEQLIPLQGNMAILSNVKGVDKKEVSKVQTNIASAVHRLQPLTEIYGAEKSMKSKRVLIAESNKRQHVVAKMALGGTGVELDIVSNMEEGRARLAENNYDIVLFDQSMRDISQFALEKNPETRSVFVTSDSVPGYLPQILELPSFPNIVSRDEEDRQFTIKNFVTTVSKLASRNYFGLEKYLSWGVDVQEVTVTNSGSRQQIIDDMEAYFKKSGIRSTNLGRMAQVTEELLMNAIYDAPRNKDGAPMYNHLLRTNPVTLEPHQYSRFRYALDGMVMAISVEDPFGGLDAETVFRYLKRCYEGGVSLNEGDSSKGGGGRGLHQIVENSNLVVFNIDPNRRTEVVALFNTDKTVAGKRNPNLHFFTV